MSKAVADYYCDLHNIPQENRCPLDFVTDQEGISQAGFRDFIQHPLRDFLATNFGATAENIATDPVKVIVMCYGVPSKIASGGAAWDISAVDSYLTMLFNESPDLGPAKTLGVHNPYWDNINADNSSWNYKHTEFATFRASSDNHFCIAS